MELTAFTPLRNSGSALRIFSEQGVQQGLFFPLIQRLQCRSEVND